jgi:hypothetical protein
MSEQTLRSTYPKGPTVRVDQRLGGDDEPSRPAPVDAPHPAASGAGQTYSGVELDKTLRGVKLPDLSPRITPGGHGQTWPRKDEPR